jgi:protein involved in polysaccharide export with SLBB domain
MTKKKNIRLIRILLIFIFGTLINAQTVEELKQLQKAYEDREKEKNASAIINQGIKSDKDTELGPVRLLVEPGDIHNYYQQKMKAIQKDLDQLNRLLISTDSIPPLSHFGYEYFSNRDTMQFIDNAIISSDYVLGYGDEIIISIWGQADQYEKATLDRDGTVFIKNAGLLYLGGKTQSEAKTYVEKRFSKVYATLNSSPPLTYIEFSIGKIKNINVTVAGHVKYPGNYVVNPTISLNNLLVLAGGISVTGSLRNIKLQRNQSIIDSVDLYPLITGVASSSSYSILDNDIILVPPRGETVAITGDVLIPAYFEIKGDNLKSLIKYSGQINNNKVIISRLESPNLIVRSDQFENIQLTNLDSIVVPNKIIKNKYISISVNNRPLNTIPWIDNVRFKTLLDILNLKILNIKNVELVRIDKNDGIQKIIKFDFKKDLSFKFLPYDYISIHLYEKFIPSKYVVINGEVNSPGVYPLINKKETLNSMLTRAGGLRLTSDINNVHVKRDSLVFGSQTGELILSHKDTIIAKPYVGVVFIEGAIHYPGNLEWSKKYKAKDYINFAGGLTANGDKKHIILIMPYGKAFKINTRSNTEVLPGSIIRISEKPIRDETLNSGRFQQVSSIITSLVSIAILARSANY